MFSSIDRRGFLRASLASAGLGFLPQALRAAQNRRDFKLALSERSLDRTLRGNKLDHLDFARVAKEDFAIEAIAYHSRYFDSLDDTPLNDLNKRAAEHGVRQILIMLDNKPDAAKPDKKNGQKAVYDLRRWIDAAKTLGCHSICIDPAAGHNNRGELNSGQAADNLAPVVAYGEKQKINVLLSNETGPATNPTWLLDVVKKLGSDYCKTRIAFVGLPQQNRYKALAALAPSAKAICATAINFDEQGRELQTDFYRAIKTVLDAGYRGYVNVEYRGRRLDEFEGIRTTIKFLERIRQQELQEHESNGNKETG